MMMTKKRKRIALVLALALSASCAFCGMLTKKTAAASLSPLTMLGASVRLDNNQGIRFTAKLNEEPSETSKYYVMIVPATWLSDATHNLNGAVDRDYYKHLIDKGLKAEDDPATPDVDERDFINMECEPADYDENNDDVYDYKVVRGTIAQVKYNNTNRQFFGVAYEQKADGTRVYADNQEKSVRSCTYVAGAALNSGDYERDETKTGYLNNMINNAYNKVVLGKSETDEQSDAVFSLPEVPAYNSVGTEIDFCVNGIKGLDLPKIEWEVKKPEGSTSVFDKNNNKLVVFDKEGTVKVSTKVAGQDLVANVNCETCYLETFDNVDNIRTDNQFRDSSTAGTWYESLTDSAGITEYGVGMGSTKFNGNGNDGIAVRFNKTEEELKSLLSDPNFQSITLRMLFRDPDTTGKCDINFFDLIKRTLPEDRWANVTITKKDIFENETLLAEFVDKQGIIDGIAKNFNKDGCGYMTGTQGKANRRFAHVPNLITLPRELYIADIKCSFGEDSSYLETFSASSINIAQGDFAANNSNVGTYLDSYTDMNGVTEYGIAKAVRDSSGRVCVRFDKTENELKEILTNEGFEKITFRILVKATDKADGASIALKFLNTVDKTAIANQWMDIELTKEEILNAELVKYMRSADNVIDSFVNINTATYGFIQAFSSTGIGHLRYSSGAAYRMIHTSVAGVEVYIDHVTYTLASAN